MTGRAEDSEDVYEVTMSMAGRRVIVDGHKDLPMAALRAGLFHPNRTVEAHEGH